VYLVGRVLGQGGFGITYLGFDLQLRRKVAIKEYIPHSIASRQPETLTVTPTTEAARADFDYGLRCFMTEGQTLALFQDHPYVVSVISLFEGNGTGYLVMAYLLGRTLGQTLTKAGGKLPYETVREIMIRVMDGLREVHSQRLLHRDISPDNIYITYQGQVKILDFGAARMAIGERSQSLSVILKEGYAPEEQYRRNGNQGPWTDVYAVGATFYRAITGVTPRSALDLLHNDTVKSPRELGLQIPPDADAAIMKALSLYANGRFQNVGDFQNALSVPYPAVNNPVQMPPSQSPPQPAPQPFQPQAFPQQPSPQPQYPPPQPYQPAPQQPSYPPQPFQPPAFPQQPSYPPQQPLYPPQQPSQPAYPQQPSYLQQPYPPQVPPSVTPPQQWNTVPVAPPAFALYDSNAVALATFLGTPLAGGALMAMNYRRMGRSGAVKAMVAGIGMTGVGVVGGLLLKSGLAAIPWLIFVFVMRAIAESDQGPAVVDHVQRGGLKASMGSAVGIGVAFLAGVSLLSVAGYFGYDAFNTAPKDGKSTPTSRDLLRAPKVVIGTKDEVYYTGTATQQDAQSVGDALKTQGYFTDTGISVFVDKDPNGTTLSYVVKEGIWDQPAMVDAFEEISRKAVPNAGLGFPIHVRLIDNARTSRKEVIVGRLDVDQPTTPGGQHTVYYYGSATQAEAQALGDALKRDGYFSGSSGATVFWAKNGGTPVMTFVVKDGWWETPSHIEAFKDLVRTVAPSVGGLPIELRLANSSVEVKASQMVTAGVEIWPGTSRRRDRLAVLVIDRDIRRRAA
jgi:serine/threonine protein kinase